jgi:hypothetical protein
VAVRVERPRPGTRGNSGSIFGLKDTASQQHHKQRYFIQGTSEWQGNGAVHHSSENWRNLLRFLPNCYGFDLVVTENRKKIFWGLRKIAKNN